MLTVKQKQQALNTAENLGSIFRVRLDGQMQEKVRRELKKSYKRLLVFSFIISAICLAIVLFLIFYGRSLMSLLVFIFVLSPLAVAKDYRDKKQRIDSGDFNCYTGIVERTTRRRDKYIIRGVDLGEPIDLAGICDEPPEEGSMATIVELCDDIFIIE